MYSREGLILTGRDMANTGTPLHLPRTRMRLRMRMRMRGRPSQPVNPSAGLRRSLPLAPPGRQRASQPQNRRYLHGQTDVRLVLPTHVVHTSSCVGTD